MDALYPLGGSLSAVLLCDLTVRAAGPKPARPASLRRVVPSRSQPPRREIRNWRSMRNGRQPAGSGSESRRLLLRASAASECAPATCAPRSGERGRRWPDTGGEKGVRDRLCHGRGRDRTPQRRWDIARPRWWRDEGLPAASRPVRKRGRPRAGLLTGRHRRHTRRGRSRRLFLLWREYSERPLPRRSGVRPRRLPPRWRSRLRKRGPHPHFRAPETKAAA